MVLWRIPDDADGPEKVQNGQKQGSAHPEAETMVNEAEYVLMNLMPDDSVLSGLREKAKEEAGLY